MALSSDYIRTSLQALYGNSVTGADIRAWCTLNDSNYQTVTKKLDQFKVGRGKWNLEVTQQKVEEIERTFQAPAVVPPVEQNLIPEKDDTFVKFGNFADVKKIIQSRLFYPTFITGLSGNGKTFSVEQACAQLKRELIRVNIRLKLMKMTLSVVLGLLMGTLHGITVPSLKHSNGEQFSFWMKSTLHPTKSSAFSLF
jgi:hypothetical protein